MSPKKTRTVPVRCGGCEWELGTYRPGWLKVCTACRRALCRTCLPDGRDRCLTCEAEDPGPNAGKQGESALAKSRTRIGK